MFTRASNNAVDVATSGDFLLRMALACVSHIVEHHFHWHTGEQTPMVFGRDATYSLYHTLKVRITCSSLRVEVQ